MSKRLMKRPVVEIEAELQAFVLVCIVEGLIREGVTAIVACLDDHHLHILGKFPKRNPRSTGTTSSPRASASCDIFPIESPRMAIRGL